MKHDMLAPRTMLLIDIVGAFLTCLITLGFFATNVIPTGLPVMVLTCLGVAAGMLGVFGAYRLSTSNDVLSTLGILAFLNIDFCILSGVLWWNYFEGLTLLGRLYFPAEILIIVVLALWELRWSMGKG